MTSMAGEQNIHMDFRRKKKKALLEQIFFVEKVKCQFQMRGSEQMKILIPQVISSF